jgi:hypothetical protein
MAGETACPTSNASQRGWNTKLKHAVMYDRMWERSDV